MDSKENTTQDKEIDLLALVTKLWIKRKFITKFFLIGLLLGIIVAFSIPKEYTTTVILAPEQQNASSNGNMGALASITGINLNNISTNDLSSDIYPDIIVSTPFLLGLSNVHISDKAAKIDTTLFAYIKSDQKIAWWKNILGIPFHLIGLFSSSTDQQGAVQNKKNTLTKAELEVISNISQRINISIDKKTNVITLTTTMQNPEVSSQVADTLTSYLQSYIISYRTEKARSDLYFTEKLYGESKIEYDKVQRKYADYLDKNQNVVLASYRVNQEKLQNEVSLAYSVYNQVAQQLQMAKVKVQDQTPVYTVIQPPIVPIVPTKPNKKMIVAGFTFLFTIATCGYILGKDLILNLNIKS